MNKQEPIFNIFPICEGKVINKIGFKVHYHDGDDQEKIEFLLSNVEEDSKNLIYISPPEKFKVKINDEIVNGLTHERYNNLVHNGTDGILYEPIFIISNAPENPLSVTTMIHNGEIKITRSQTFPTETKTSFTQEIYEEIHTDYLIEFTDEEGFHFDRLINDDFIDAIKILFKQKKYVSSLKLLMSAIDTIAFLEFGDERNNFKNWMNKYCELSKINITEEELWEYRNSLLHMTNSYSRKVLNNEVLTIAFYVSKKDIEYLTGNVEGKYFNLTSLLEIVFFGITKWCDSYNTEREKFKLFVDRYDLIISDSRYNKIQ